MSKVRAVIQDNTQ